MNPRTITNAAPGRAKQLAMSEGKAKTTHELVGFLVLISIQAAVAVNAEVEVCVAFEQVPRIRHGALVFRCSHEVPVMPSQPPLTICKSEKDRHCPRASGRTIYLSEGQPRKPSEGTSFAFSSARNNSVLDAKG